MCLALSRGNGFKNFHVVFLLDFKICFGLLC